jgi:hypothetical protein
MAITVKLKDIIGEMETQSEFHSLYLSKTTGEIIMVTDDHFRAAEDEDDLSGYPEWEQEAIQVAGKVLGSDDYISLPSQFDIHEYKIMEEFCLSLDNQELRDKMFHSIKGKGAFRRFKDNIFKFNIEEDWFEYRREALKQIAIDWCEKNNIAYSEK